MKNVFQLPRVSFFKQRLYIFPLKLSNDYNIQKRSASLFYHVLLIKHIMSIWVKLSSILDNLGVLICTIQKVCLERLFFNALILFCKQRSNYYAGMWQGSKIRGGRYLVMRRAAAARRRLLICQNLGGRTPPPCPPAFYMPGSIVYYYEIR